MTTHDKIEDLKREICSLTEQEREENIQILLPIIREHCVFKVSWLNHMIYCDDRINDEEFRKKLKTYTVRDYQQFQFPGGVFISWWAGRVCVTMGEVFGKDVFSEEDFFTPSILKCKELGLKLDFSDAENYLSEKLAGVHSEINVLEKLEGIYAK